MKNLCFLFVFGISVSVGFGQPQKKTDFGKFFDFSFAGYHLGKELPDRSIQGKKMFSVLDFGAIPNDGLDDIKAIQKAVDEAEKSGGGVVTFPPGTFDFDVETAQGFVHIKKSNIVLRGYGDGLDGTILHDHRPSHSPDPKMKWLGGTFPSFFKLGERPGPLDSALAFPVRDAETGSINLFTETGSRVEPGIYFLVQTNPSDTSLTKDLIFPLKKMGSSHAGQGIKFEQMVRVLKNEKGILTLDAPINWKLRQKWRPRLIKATTIIEESGIENFRLICDWKDEFVHHKDDIHDSGWDQIHCLGLENGWVRNITSVSPSSAISLSWCKNCVVYDCQITGNRGHNGFNMGGGSTRNLWMNLKGGSAMHTYSMSGFCSGNVYYMCFTNAPTSIDCHGSLCIHNLFDNVYGAVVQNGGNNKAVPPAHAQGLVLYNFHPGLENAYNGRITTKILKLNMYPGIKILGLKSILGYPVSIEDEKGVQHYKDFVSSFGEVQSLNAQNGLPIPSLFTWQHKKRYGRLLPQEPGKEEKEVSEE